MEVRAQTLNLARAGSGAFRFCSLNIFPRYSADKNNLDSNPTLTFIIAHLDQ